MTAPLFGFIGENLQKKILSIHDQPPFTLESTMSFYDVTLKQSAEERAHTTYY